MGPLALLPIRTDVCCGFLSPLKVYCLGRVWTPRSLGPVASTLTTTPPRRLGLILENHRKLYSGLSFHKQAYVNSYSLFLIYVNRRIQNVPFKTQSKISSVLRHKNKFRSTFTSMKWTLQTSPVTLEWRLSLLLGRCSHQWENRCRCEHDVFTSRTSVYSRTSLRIRICAAVPEAFSNAHPDKEVQNKGNKHTGNKMSGPRKYLSRDKAPGIWWYRFQAVHQLQTL
jgi:hypothetical protein